MALITGASPIKPGRRRNRIPLRRRKINLPVKIRSRLKNPLHQVPRLTSHSPVVPGQIFLVVLDIITV